MPRSIIPLNDQKCRTAKTTGTAKKLFDGGGLYLLLTESGSKLWRQKYRFAGKERTLSLGAYPEVSLLDARKKRAETKKILDGGKDPNAERRKEELIGDVARLNTLPSVGREWLKSNRPNWSGKYSDKLCLRLENDIYPWFEKTPIAEIEAPEILAALRRVVERGALYTAKRLQSYLSQIFRYAIATGRAKRDVAADLRGALPRHSGKNYPMILDPVRIGELLRASYNYKGSIVVKHALMLAPILFCRPTELRSMEWTELSQGFETYTIPPERMKGRLPHLVPLSRQARNILKEMQDYTGSRKHVFSSPMKSHKYISENTVNDAFRSMGFGGDEICGHGLRHMASTLLNEAGWPSDVVERQLAHTDKNIVRGIYNKAQYLDERRRMMQVWSDYLELLRHGQYSEAEKMLKQN